MKRGRKDKKIKKKKIKGWGRGIKGTVLQLYWIIERWEMFFSELKLSYNLSEKERAKIFLKRKPNSW